ncbi:hypothetical protein HYDPIDRAFT_115623 [Hydnomerulius pinastri MD-312]|uniref:Exosome complex exonuclease RRP44 S1 domain-containing protein n=1 Tax=Hydnomerulius pinastri MD-312 TaxID=994086 RepID=A0A0C9V7Z7_9AGAM|nr:hypothetical protein HYDPIDRAFT_115623 [Hydnomerulius pinastri MD-312]
MSNSTLRTTPHHPVSFSITSVSKDVTISVFDKVKVRIEVERDKNAQRGRVKMTLVSPVHSRGL